MKRVRCPKCDNYITFDETQYTENQRLVFQCPECNKQFAIRIGVSKLHSTHKDEKQQQTDNTPAEGEAPYGQIVVVENVFHYKQTIPLQMGDNVIGRYAKGTDINTPIETVDPSVDTKHCIIRVQRDKQGKLQYILRDAPSNTGTFLDNSILRDRDRMPITGDSIITIGATTLLLEPAE